MPEQDAVLAITSESPSMQGELDLVWEHLLSAMKPGALPADRPAQRRLQEKLAALTLLPPKGRPSSPMAAAVSGRSFKMETNAMGVQNVTLDFRTHSCLFALKDQKGEYRIECGLENWVEGRTSMPGTPPKLTSGDLGPSSRVAASGTWKDANTFEMTWRFQETPHHDTVTCHFEGNKVRVQFMNSVTRLSPSHKENRPVLAGARLL